MPVTTRRLLAGIVPLLLLASCGDDDEAADDEPGAAPIDDDAGGAEVATDAWPPADLTGDGSAGSIVVDGTEYAIDVVRRCDLDGFFAGEGRQRELEVQGAGLADPSDELSEAVEVSVFTGTQQSPEAESQGVGWDGPEGLYDGYETGPNRPLEVGNDRITGTMLLRSALGNPPVEATVDLAVPDSGPVACHD